MKELCRKCQYPERFCFSHVEYGVAQIVSLVTGLDLHNWTKHLGPVAAFTYFHRCLLYQRRFSPTRLITRDAAGRFTKWIAGRSVYRTRPDDFLRPLMGGGCEG